MSTGSNDPNRSTGGEGDGPTGRSPGGRSAGGGAGAGSDPDAGGRGTPAAGQPGSGGTPNPPVPPAAAGDGSGGAGASDRAGRGSTRSSRRKETDAKAAQTGGTGADLPKKDGGPAAPVEQPTPFTQQLGRITIVVLAALFGVFAVANSQRVDFSWVFSETLVRESATGEVTGGVPLIFLLLTAFVVGSVVTLLVERFVTRSRRARRAAKEGNDGKRRSG